MKLKYCLENDHKRGCRAARPLCRWRRRIRGVCNCGAYHFPHRLISGACGNPAANWAALDQPLRHGVRLAT